MTQKAQKSPLETTPIMKRHYLSILSSIVGFASRLLMPDDDECAARLSSNRVVANFDAGKTTFVGRMFDLSSNLGGEILFGGLLRPCSIEDLSDNRLLIPEVAAVDRPDVTADVLPDVPADALQKILNRST